MSRTTTRSNCLAMKMAAKMPTWLGLGSVVGLRVRVEAGVGAGVRVGVGSGSGLGLGLGRGHGRGRGLAKPNPNHEDGRQADDLVWVRARARARAPVRAGVSSPPGRALQPHRRECCRRRRAACGACAQRTPWTRRIPCGPRPSSCHVGMHARCAGSQGCRLPRTVAGTGTRLRWLQLTSRERARTGSSACRPERARAWDHRLTPPRRSRSAGAAGSGGLR